MCNLYSITTNQAAILSLFRIVNRYVGNLPPMPGVFPDYPASSPYPRKHLQPPPAFHCSAGARNGRLRHFMI
ncbi:hypothetical protein ACVI1L_007848 [Bradyrhizobium sp. USDA 4516]